MVKGPARNAQFYFVTEYVMPKYAIRNFHDALNTGRELWKQLSDEEKAPYKAKEQQWKAYMRGPAGDKYRKDCTGNNMQEELDKQKEKEEFEQRVYKYATEYIETDREKAMDQPFFFIAFEFALLDDQRNYYPCEVGLVKYTLRRGIEKCVHYFLHPGEYPLGTKAAAKKHSEERHKIPYLCFDKATDGYSAVFAHMRDILLSRNAGSREAEVPSKYPPIYCHPNDVEMNRKCLQVLFDRAQRHESERIQYVASAAVLVKTLYGEDKCGEGRALELFSSTAFDHERNVACDWHYEIECIHCALGTARKLAFTLSDNLKTTYNISLTPAHLPTVESYSALPPATAFESFNAPKKSWRSGGSMVGSTVGSSVSGYGYNDSVISAPSSRGRQQTAWGSASNYQEPQPAAGRGRGAPVSSDFDYRQPAQNSSYGDGATSDDFNDDEWTTVSAHKPTSSGMANNFSQMKISEESQPARGRGRGISVSAGGNYQVGQAAASYGGDGDYDDNWTTVSSNKGARGSTSNNTWDTKLPQTNQNYNPRRVAPDNAWGGQASAKPASEWDDDWDDEEARSVVSSTVQQSGQVWGTAAAANSNVSYGQAASRPLSSSSASSNPYARPVSAAIGRGRGFKG